MKENKKPEQPNLFGDQDFIFNVLHTEHSDINAEIERNQETIRKKKEKILYLEDKKAEVDKAIKIVKRQKKELEAATKKRGGK